MRHRANGGDGRGGKEKSGGEREKGKERRQLPLPPSEGFKVIKRQLEQGNLEGGAADYLAKR